MSKNIYIIDDDEVVCESLTAIINTTFDGYQVVGSNINGQLGLKECILLKPDLAIVDIRLPDVNGIEILHILKKRDPHIKVIMYSGILDIGTVRHAYDGNADGILEKPGSVDDIKTAIETVISGNTYYSKNVIEKLLAQETVAPFVRRKY